MTLPGWIVRRRTSADGMSGAKILKLIRRRDKKQERYFTIFEVLLIFKALVHCD
jgi:hypothetical protein